jgi:hypothetical protein
VRAITSTIALPTPRTSKRAEGIAETLMEERGRERAL